MIRILIVLLLYIQTEKKVENKTETNNPTDKILKHFFKLKRILKVKKSEVGLKCEFAFQYQTCRYAHKSTKNSRK